MKRFLALTLIFSWTANIAMAQTNLPSANIRLMTLDPGHFHAGLVQKEMYQGVSKQVHVYAPLGSDLMAHLNRILAFNNRDVSPTAWELEVHTGPDFMARMLNEKPELTNIPVERWPGY